ncbi:MAG TPA: hypothetical protein VFB78_19635 [Acidimicrobiales bacterium]|jgi:uncharacterized membrane protein YeaQ/YmgE (transglycosylase-associated protein family)|nr:hypothetical protein [Acidimicrobiales bacterium]
MFWIISVLLSGLIVGALGRLAIPGPNPMSIGMTLAVGLGGSIAGGIVGALILGSRSAGIIILQVLAAAGIIYLMQRRDNANTA